MDDFTARFVVFNLISAFLGSIVFGGLRFIRLRWTTLGNLHRELVLSASNSVEHRTDRTQKAA